MAEKEYIEREALWRAFEYEPFYDNADRDEIVLPKIDAFPAADVAPVVHGRWELENESWGQMQCSVCKKQALLEESKDDTGKVLLYVTSEFCPNCGAKMDLEGGNT